jgi:hypothetical protein
VPTFYSIIHSIKVDPEEPVEDLGIKQQQKLLLPPDPDQSTPAEAETVS